MHIVFSGGGTAGHINPALSIARFIKNKYPECKISFVGTKKGMESRLVPKAGYDFYGIDVAGFQRKLTPKNMVKNVKAVYLALSASAQSAKLLKSLKPDAVVGTGGYVCGPILRKAAKLGIPTAVHEANAYPGVTVKMLAPIIDCVMLAVPDAGKNINCKNPPVITGNPIRRELINVSRSHAREKLGIKENDKVVLSFGGSLGAKVINDAVLGVAEKLEKEKGFYLYHGTGKTGHSAFMSGLKEKGLENSKYIKVYEYIDNMDIMLAAADVVVCRAGAMTVNELQVCGKPSVLIPSPYVAENHQFHNAMSLKKVGAAELIEEKDLTAESLYNVLEKLISDDASLSKMSIAAKSIAIADADRRIADEVMRIINNK